MFPGMQGPQPLPENESYAQFWRCATKLLAFTITVAAISKSIQYADHRARDIIIEM